MRSPLLTALLHPLNIVMAGLSLFAGLVSAWWLFPVGVLFWIVMVVMVSRDRALRFNAKMQRREPLAQRFQPYFDRVERAQVSIFNTLSASPSRMQRAFKPIQNEVDKLSHDAYALCRRMTALENYRLVSQSQSNFTIDLDRLSKLVEDRENPVLGQDHVDSQRALQERPATLQDVATQLNRVEAYLLSLANEMDGVLTELVRLQAAGPDMAEAQVSIVVRRLQEKVEQLRVFERQAVLSCIPMDADV
jgi:hypothetical protein